MVNNLLNKIMMNESRIVRKRNKRLNESAEHEDRLEAVLKELEHTLNDKLASHGEAKLQIGHGGFDEESGSFKMDVIGFDEDAFDDEELRNFENSVEEEIRAFFKKRDPEAIVEADPERDFTFQITTGCLNESADKNKLHKLAEITKDFISNYPEIELSADLDDQGSGEYFLEFDFNADAFETETEKQEFENKLQQAIEDWSKASGFTVNRSEDEDVQMAFWIEKPDDLNEDAFEDEASKFNYRLLDRLKRDCEYFLKAGGRNPKHLWAGSPEKQIAKMREIYDAFPDDKKPEWLSVEDIDSYEEQMLGECEENCSECGKPTSECECDKDSKPIVEAVAEFREITDPMIGYVIPSDLNDAFTQKDLSDEVAAAGLDLRRAGDNFIVGKILGEKMDTEDLAEFFNDLDYHVFKDVLTNILNDIVDAEKAEEAGYGDSFIKRDEIFDALGQPRWFVK